MDPIKEFQEERLDTQKKMALDAELRDRSLQWMLHADKYKYIYNFSWMGRPIIKFPQDIIALQEVIWNVQPDLIIETGIAHGGSIIFSASMLELMGGNGHVVGVDIDIRSHNRIAIEKHPMYKRITMIEGSSTSPDVVAQVATIAKNYSNVMVVLDSLHTHTHVLEELRLYCPFVSINSYIILPDTLIEFFPKNYYSENRPWDVGNNPYTALKAFLKENSDFVQDDTITNKLLITEAFGGGFLQRIR
jgi:cephalosporin hydroxylase